MTRAEFDAHCGSMKGTTHVVQWGGASVWKIGGRIFAICSKWGAGDDPKISFKCSELTFAILTEQPGIVPAPYLARAGWAQIETTDAMGDEDIRHYIETAYSIILSRLTKRVRRELGLDLTQGT